MEKILKIYLFNGSNSTYGTEMPAGEPQGYAFIPWAFFNVLIILCGALGNILVIMAYRNPRMKTVTNLFIANLAFADLNVVLINAPFNILKLKLETWPFGLAICKIVTSLMGITLSASVGSLVAIAVDRYRAIVHPLKPRMRTRHAVYILFAIWIAAFVIAAPMLVFSKVKSAGGIEDCMEEWPKGDFPWQFAYVIFIFVTLYTIPLGTMCVLYFMIYYNLSKTKPLQKSAQRARVSVLRMLVMVVVIFALCWLPFQVIFMYTAITNHLDGPITYAVLFSLWLTTANSSFNPVIYAVFNLNYRREFSRILTCGDVSGKYLGCDTSLDGQRSIISRTTIKKSTSQFATVVSKTSGRKGRSLTDGEVSTQLFANVKRKELNGNTHDLISDNKQSPSMSCRSLSQKYNDRKEACFESVC